MATWAKHVLSVVTVPEGVTDKRITTYFSDAAASPPNDMRIQVTGVDSTGAPYTFDCSLSELTITEEQKALLVGAGEAAVAQLLALQGFASTEGQ